MPAPFVGHPAQEMLVEILAHADRGRMDAAAPQLGGVAQDLGVVDDALVGETVGQKHDPVDDVRSQACPTCSQPRSQPPHRSVLPFASMPWMARAAASTAAADAVVEGTTTSMWSSKTTDGEAVAGIEPAEGRHRGLLGEADLLARHRPRAVENQTEVHGRALRGFPSGATMVARTCRVA
jgi:hypothetical protein